MATAGRRLLLAVALLCVLSTVQSACPCNLASSHDCANSPRCASCLTRPESCECWTGCNPGRCEKVGPEWFEITECYVGCCGVYYDSLCRKEITITVDECAECTAGYWGVDCVECPGGHTNPCSGRGDCRDGVYGSGLCVCDAGYNGDVCQYSDADDCNGNGRVQLDGSCDCDEEWADNPLNNEKCSICSGPSYSGTSCTLCENDATCGGRNIGYVESPRNEGCVNGACDCSDGYGGQGCNTCGTNYYPQNVFDPALCTYCNRDVTCNSRGDCNTSTGQCECDFPYTYEVAGQDCNACAPGYFGADCSPCPNGGADPCFESRGLGSCDDGKAGSGTCACNAQYYGDDCNLPLITAVTPTSGPSGGGFLVTLTGFNFLSSGTVQYLDPAGAVSLQIYSYDDTEVVVVMAAGSGAAPVRLTSRDQALKQRPSNQDIDFTYDAPTLNNLTPLSGPSINRKITVTGSSFGLGGTLQVDGVDVPAGQVGLWNHEFVEFTADVDVGTGHTFRILTTDNRPSTNSLTFSYDPPQVSGVGSEPITAGGTLLVLGRNFGQTDEPVTTVAGVLCTYVSHTDGEITCTVAAGTGQGNTVEVFVGAQSGNAAVMKYQSPEVDGVAGCTAGPASSTVDCPTAGSVPVQISGLNFGSNPALISVSIGGNDCANVAVLTAHSLIQCDLPMGFGLSVDVTVTVDGLSDSAALLSYATAEILPQTLTVFGQAPVIDGAISRLQLLDLTTPTDVQFGGRYFGTDHTVVVVTYGPPEDPSRYSCAVQAGWVASTSIRCTTQAGVGGNHRFQVTVQGVESNIGDDVLAYAAPIITAGSLRVPGGTGASFLDGTASLGEQVRFDGQFFGIVPDDIRITYAKVGAASGEVCQLVALLDTQITCRTAPGNDNALVFTVSVGTGSSAQSTEGEDLYSYPVSPIVESVTGCPGDISMSGEAAECPTTGLDSDGARIRIVLTGQFFGNAGASVSVGGSACSAVEHDLAQPQKLLSCLLPAGVGLNRPVVVKQGSTYSKAHPLLSYSKPILHTLTSTDGCELDFSNNTIGCPRAGGITVTLTGSGFGASDALVLIGGSACTSVTHDAATPDTIVYCSLPEGVGLERPVLLVQDLGEINDGVLLVSYEQCSPGTYSDGEVACTSCDPGRYTPISGLRECILCPPGTAQNNTGQSECIECARGKAQSQAGQDTCDVCLAGSRAESEGSTECQPCPVGSFSAANEARECALCAPGRSQPTPGQSGCVDCQPGRATADRGQSQCQACVGGYFATGSANSRCDPCPPGEQGEFLTASTQCVQCALGRFSADLGQSTCELCAVGTYAAGLGAVECTPCPVGKFANVEGSKTDCTPCNPGRFAALEGTVECEECRSGSANDQFGLGVSCPLCVAGKFAAVRGRVTCEDCAVGTVNFLPGQLACNGCQPGRFSNTPGATSCEMCPAGKYGATKLVPGATECLECGQGTFASAKGQAECKLCPGGRVQPLNNSAECDACDLGKFSKDPGQTVCDSCIPGTFANTVASRACEPCPAGRYADANESTACTDCQPGKFQRNVAQISCEPCPIATAAYASGTIDCLACGPGKFGNDTGLENCYSCPPGQYNNARTGSTECKLCEVGKFTTEPGFNECRSCAPGSFNLVNGSREECTACSPGKYQDLGGQGGCVDCPPGRFTTKNSTIACSLCFPGTYQNASGQSECVDCSVGSAQISGGQATCVPCPAGTYSLIEGQLECTACSVGKYSTTVGRTSQCEDCPIGRAAGLEGSAVCEKCAAGRFIPSAGQAACLPCSEGTFQNSTGSDSCTECPPATYMPITGAAQCLDCPEGRAASGAAFRSCSACSLGKFQASTRSTECDPCPPGRFQSQEGRAECAPSPTGSFAYAADGAKQATVCSDRTVAPYTGMSVCFRCDSVASHNDEHDRCICDIGFYAVASASGQGANGTSTDGSATTLLCRPCPRGALCDTKGQTEDSLGAEPGWWLSTNNSKPEFSQCMLAEHCLGTNGDRTALCAPNREGPLCAICAPGHESNTYLSECTLCPDTSQSIIYACAIFVAVTACMVVMFWIILRNDDALARTAVARSGRSMTSRQALTSEDRAMSRRSLNTGDLQSSSAWNVGQDGEDGEVDFGAGGQDGFAAGNGVNRESSGGLNRTSTLAEQAEEQKADMGIESRSGANVMSLTYKLKILVGFLQIGSNLSFIVSVPWPTYFLSFMRIFNFVNFDFVPWQSLSCAAKVDFFDKYLLVTLIPLAVLVMLVLCFVVPTYIKDRRDMKDHGGRRLARDILRRRFWKMVLFLLFMMYPFVSTSVLSMFVCHESIDGVRYLEADFTLTCTRDSRWFSWVPFGAVMVLVYPIGIPLTFFSLIKSNSKSLQEPKTRMQLGFLYAAYHTNYAYFEICDMMHKLALTSLIRFLPAKVQMGTGLAVIVIYMCCLALLRPYVRKSDDRLHLFVQVVLYNIVLLGYVLTKVIEFKLESKTNVLLSILLIGLVCGLVVMFFAMVGKNAWKMLLKRKRDKMLKAGQVAPDLDQDEYELSASGEDNGFSGDYQRQLSTVTARQCDEGQLHE